MGALSSWKRASLFGNNIRIMGCTWLSNLPMYSLAVIQAWRVIIGPTEYCTMILMPKPSQNLSHVSLLEPVIWDCKLPWCSPNVNSSWCREQREGHSSDHIMRAFPFVWCPGFMVVTPSFTHLSITFSYQRFSSCSPTMDVGLWSWHQTVFVETGSSGWIFGSAVCHLCCCSSVIF
jgi:hypothetical protein